MNYFDLFIEGMIAGLGMVTIMTVFSIIMFKISERWIIKKIGSMWDKLKGHVDYSGSVDFQNQHSLEWNVKDENEVPK